MFTFFFKDLSNSCRILTLLSLQWQMHPEAGAQCFGHLKQRVWLDVWMEGSLRNRMAPVCDLESVCNAEEIVLFFFPVHMQCLCVEATTDSLNQW